MKRRHIKSTLSPTQHNLQHTHTTEETVKATSATATKPDRTEETKEEKKEDEKEGMVVERCTDSLLCQEDPSKEVQGKSPVLKDGQCKFESPSNSPEISSDSILQSSSSSSIPNCEPVSLVSDDPDISLEREQLEILGKKRQHNTESLALSSELSSFSEGELSPTKPIGPTIPGEGSTRSSTSDTSKGEKSKKEGRKKNKKKRKGRGKSEQKDAGVNDADGVQYGSSPEVDRSMLGMKQEREGGKKKDRGGEKRKEGGRKLEPMKKGAPMKAKKASIMRIRFDSLTTSSDEERVIDSPRLSRVEEVAEPLAEDEKKENERESKERLRQRLEHKILSKKPPAMFETPATEPLFHQVHTYI